MQRALNTFLLTVCVLTLFAAPSARAGETGSHRGDGEVDLFVVNFTASWCPNCAILDPALAQALERIDAPGIKSVTLDLTNGVTAEAAFHAVNGTVIASAYADYVGRTGLVVMVAADSGKVIDCATRVVDAEGIRLSILDALHRVQTRQPFARSSGPPALCPPPNRRIPVSDRDSS